MSTLEREALDAIARALHSSWPEGSRKTYSAEALPGMVLEIKDMIADYESEVLDLRVELAAATKRESEHEGEQFVNRNAIRLQRERAEAAEKREAELHAALEWMASSRRAIIIYPDGIDTGEPTQFHHDGTGTSIAAALLAAKGGAE